MTTNTVQEVTFDEACSFVIKLDKKTQRAAWMVGDAKAPVYEAGLVNLTKDEASMMVHYANDRSVQATLYRIKQDADQSSSE